VAPKNRGLSPYMEDVAGRTTKEKLISSATDA